METNDGTGAGLLSFLDWAGRTGEMNPATARAWAATARAVLAVEAEPDTVDVRGLDVESLLDRFQMLNRTKYSSGSMTTYRSRFRQAVSAYQLWLDGDPGWKPAKTRSNGNARKASKKAEQQSEAVTPAAEPVAPEASHAHSSPRMVAYDMPLRPDMLVRLTLPVDLTSADAERVAAFVRSLAFASFPSPSGQGTDTPTQGG